MTLQYYTMILHGMLGSSNARGRSWIEYVPLTVKLDVPKSTYADELWRSSVLGREFKAEYPLQQAILEWGQSNGAWAAV